MTATRSLAAVAALLLAATPGATQTPDDPFPAPIPAEAGVVNVRVTEFATLPDIGGEAARPMLLIEEPGTRRLFVNDMRGPLYSLGRDGGAAVLYLDVNAPGWSVGVQSNGRERGVQSFAFHPQFGQPGTRGYGKFYTVTDTTNITPKADFRPMGGMRTHDTVLLEWTARNATAATYDGGPPRELLRFEQPFANHNAGHLTFNPFATPRDTDYGLLYMGFADGGSGNDPFGHAQNLGSAFGKILRLDPLGSNSPNGRYGIPPSNPFVSDGKTDTLGEIYAFGVRNPQRFFWDSKTGRMFVAEIGQNLVEEISVVTPGANLGWNIWEASFGFADGKITLANQRRDSRVTFPIIEYAHKDPLLQGRSSVTGGVVYRGTAIPQLRDLMLFGDIPSGEVFYVRADALPDGGQDAIRRVLFRLDGGPRTLLQIIKEKNAGQGKKPADRADLRFGTSADGRVFLLNKSDGVIRMLVPDALPRPSN